MEKTLSLFLLVVLLSPACVVGANDALGENTGIVSSSSFSSSSSQKMINGKLVKKTESQSTQSDDKALANGEIVYHEAKIDKSAADTDGITGKKSKMSDSARYKNGKKQKAKKARLVTGEFSLAAVSADLELGEESDAGQVFNEVENIAGEMVTLQAPESDIIFIGTSAIWEYVSHVDAFELARTQFALDNSPETAINLAEEIVYSAREAGCKDALRLIVISAQ